MLTSLNNHGDPTSAELPVRPPTPTPTPGPWLDLVLNRPDWPLWRRMLNLPTDDAKTRKERWQELARLLEPDAEKTVLKLPVPDRDGIFGDSLVQLELLESARHETPFCVEGGAWNIDRCNPAELTCPFGRLIVRKRVEGFGFDITEVDGILASESSKRRFSSINEFGRDFTEYLGMTVDPDGLASMLAHNDIRIAKENSSDYVALRLWDGRLFLMNDGGSHHFAGASFIARRLDVPVPLSSPLEIYAFNAPAVTWLTSNFSIFLVQKKSCSEYLVPISALLGHCYQWEVPGVVCPDAVLILAPTGRRLSRTVVSAFAQAGVPDLSQWFDSLLTRQVHNQKLAIRRFGDRARSALVSSQ